MPTLGQYMIWLRSIGGDCVCGIGADPVIGMVPRTKLTSLEGLSVVITHIHQKDRLSKFLVQYLDRRLCVVSPWKHLAEQ